MEQYHIYSQYKTSGWFFTAKQNSSLKVAYNQLQGLKQTTKI